MNPLAETIIKQLKKKGFVLQLYEATSTNSIYLKLDYGVCNSIRISDHPGKSHLKYRYNIGPHIQTYRKRNVYQNGVRMEQYYYPEKDLDKMIKDIVNTRKMKQYRYGDEQYQKYMEKNKYDHKNERGFWRDARLI